MPWLRTCGSEAVWCLPCARLLSCAMLHFTVVLVILKRDICMLPTAEHWACSGVPGMAWLCELFNGRLAGKPSSLHLGTLAHRPPASVSKLAGRKARSFLGNRTTPRSATYEILPWSTTSAGYCCPQKRERLVVARSVQCDCSNQLRWASVFF